MAEIDLNPPIPGQDRGIWGEKNNATWALTEAVLNDHDDRLDAADLAIAGLEEGVGAPTDVGLATLINTDGTASQGAVIAQNLEASAVNTTVTWANGLPATETLSTPIGPVVKTYTWSAARPVSCAWNMPAPLADLVETFTYDTAGNPTGSTFSEV